MTTATSARARCLSVTRLALIALVFLGVFGSPAPGSAQYFGKNKFQTRNLQWKTLTTPHFEILHYEGAEELAVRASLIAEQAYREFSDRLDLNLPWRVPFVLYASHSDFSQTNISDSLIGEGTGGFSEPFRNRMVLPYNGSHADFVHVIRHELVHVFMFQMAFGRSGNIGRSAFFNIPLWFAEGIAEWFSHGWDGQADMFMRDATINDYLMPLALVGGFFVYKEGQAAMRLLSERYGPEKLVEFWRRVGKVRSLERALYGVYGLKMEDLDELFAKTLRKRYWPSYGDLEEPEEFSRRLTDHVEARAYYNERPALSPAGDLVAFFSDRDGFGSLYLQSALDGKVLRRLAQGQRSSRFESFHSFRSGIGFDPTGNELAFVAKSGNRETLHTIDVHDGKVTRSIKLEFDIASSPSWSPDGGAIALVGTRHGRTDLYLIDLDGSWRDLLAPRSERTGVLTDGLTVIRLTDDVGDESSPAWSPDGEQLAFAFNPRAEIDFEFEIQADGNRKLLWARPRTENGVAGGRIAPGGSIVVLDLKSGRRSDLFGEQHGRHNPVWVGPRTLCLVDKTNGISNLAMVELDSSLTAVQNERLLTNVLGGVSQLTYARAADRLVFSAFHQAGWDLYAIDDFLGQWAEREPPGQAPTPVTLEPPSVVLREAPFDSIPDPDRVGLVEPYRTRFQLDTSQAFGGGAIYFNSAGGLGMANVISLSDMLGDNRLRFLLNFYGSFDNSDLAASYFYLKRRIDLGVGVFHYNNYYNSFITSIGELLPEDTLFRERSYGLFGLASYPLSTFERFELELQFNNVEWTFFEVLETVPGQESSPFFQFIESEKKFSRLLVPSLSFIHDTAFYGAFGPVTGSRYSLSFAPSIRVTGSSLDRRSGFVDLRKYWMPWRRNTFAARLIGAFSAGDDPRSFVLGGPYTLRGFDFYDYQTTRNLSGSNLVMFNLEYRLPFLDYLIFGWPGSWGFRGIGATVFFDLGTAWTDDVVFFGRDLDGRWGFQDLRGNYGFGIRTRIGFLPLKFDWAWKTDLRRSQELVFHFSIGPEF